MCWHSKERILPNEEIAADSSFFLFCIQTQDAGLHIEALKNVHADELQPHYIYTNNQTYAYPKLLAE